MDWRIYYANGFAFSSDDGAPWEAPRTHVQVVQQKNLNRAPKRELFSGDAKGEINYYCWQYDTKDIDPWEDGRWVPHSDAGLFQYLQEINPFQVVLFGYEVPEKQFLHIFGRAFRDENFRELKSDFDPEEE